MELKKPLFLFEQIIRLKEHGMIIDDELFAIKVLTEISYYRFTGYTLQFRKEPSDSNYINGLNFNKVYQIYQFDKELRYILRKHIEKVEIFFRTQISYGFSTTKCMNPPHNQHYDWNNYYNKNGFKSVIENFKRETDYYKESLIVKHHKTKYMNQMPLWVMVELMSFSNISKLYSSMYISEKQVIANEIGISFTTLTNHLHCLSVLRNKCAHAARLYNTNFNPPVKFNSEFLKKNPELQNNTLFAYIILLLKRLPKKEYKDDLIINIDALIKKFKVDIDFQCIGFPENYQKILKLEKP
ncbi:MAG: Abi family protein [Saccharofermentanales bacterium]